MCKYGKSLHAAAMTPQLSVDHQLRLWHFSVFIMSMIDSADDSLTSAMLVSTFCTDKAAVSSQNCVNIWWQGKVPSREKLAGQRVHLRVSSPV